MGHELTHGFDDNGTTAIFIKSSMFGGGSYAKDKFFYNSTLDISYI